MAPSRFPELHLPARSFCLRVSGAVAPSALVLSGRISPAGDLLMAIDGAPSGGPRRCRHHREAHVQVNAGGRGANLFCRFQCQLSRMGDSLHSFRQKSRACTPSPWDRGRPARTAMRAGRPRSQGHLHCDVSPDHDTWYYFGGCGTRAFIGAHSFTDFRIGLLSAASNAAAMARQRASTNSRIAGWVKI